MLDLPLYVMDSDSEQALWEWTSFHWAIFLPFIVTGIMDSGG